MKFNKSTFLYHLSVVSIMSISVALAVVWSFFRPVAFSDSLMKSLLDYTNHPVVIQLKEVDESIRTEIIERVNDIQLTLVSFNISEKEKREKFRLFMVDAPKEALKEGKGQLQRVLKSMIWLQKRLRSERVQVKIVVESIVLHLNDLNFQLKTNRYKRTKLNSLAKVLTKKQLETVEKILLDDMKHDRRLGLPQ